MTNVYVLNGLLENLEPYFEASGIPMDEYAPAGFDEHTYGGELYAFPSTMGTYFFYYNQDIFDRRGVAYPPWDWDRAQFLDAARKLRDPVSGLYAVDNRNWVTTFLPWLWAHGGDWFSPDRHRSLLDSDVAIEVQQFLADLIHVYDVHIHIPTTVITSVRGNWRCCTVRPGTSKGRNSILRSGVFAGASLRRRGAQRASLRSSKPTAGRSQVVALQRGSLGVYHMV